MDSLIFLGVLILIAVPIAAIAAFVMVLGARRDIAVMKRVMIGLDARLATLEPKTGRSTDAAAAERPSASEPAKAEFVPAWTLAFREPKSGTAPSPEDAPTSNAVDEAAQPNARDESEPPADVATLDAAREGTQPTRPEAPPVSPLPSDGGLEERIGTKWTVWIGGAALALGLIFLVQYSIEQGLFGPAVRIGFATLLSAAIVAAGEYLRRREIAWSIAGLPTAHIPAVLTAAGASGLFATVWAAHALYGFLGSGAAFVALGVVGIATMAAALVHGPWLGVLGILAAYGTPILVHSNKPNPAALVVFLIVVTAAAYGVARLRLWRGVASVALGAASLWAIGMIDLTAVGLFDAGWAMGFTVALFVLTAGVLVASLDETTREARDTKLDLYGLAVLAVTSVLVLGAYDVTPTRLGEIGLGAVLIGLAALAWFVPAVVPAVAIAAVLALTAAMVDHLDLVRAFAEDTLARGADGLVLTAPALALDWLWIHGTIAALLGGFGLGAALRATPSADRSSGWFALAGTATPVLMLVIAWGRVSSFETHHGFALVALGLAAGFAFVAHRAIGRETADRPALSVAVTAVGTIAAIGAGFAIALDRAAMTVALALMIPAIAWVWVHRPIDALRGAAAVTGLVVLGRLAWDPALIEDIGRTPIFNALLPGYGIPALGTAYAAWVFRKGPVDRRQALIEALAMIFAGLLVLIEIRHMANGGDLFAPTLGHVELGLDVTMAFVFSIALQRLRRVFVSRIVARVMDLLPPVTALVAGGGLCLAVNPLFGFDGQTATVGSLFVGYALPALAGAVAARLSRRAGRSSAVVTTQAMTAYGLGFVWVSLMVRSAFHGTDLGGGIEDAEMWAYSGTWLAYGVATLTVGLRLGSKPVRLLSGVVIAATATKVFLLDLAGIGGVWRAFSFLGLGAVLIGIALVYQRWVFPRGEGGGRPPSA